jgi:hypothetical protein
LKPKHQSAVSLLIIKVSLEQNPLNLVPGVDGNGRVAPLINGFQWAGAINIRRTFSFTCCRVVGLGWMEGEGVTGAQINDHIIDRRL